MELYSFYKSSAAYRVRIALALKGLDYIYRPVALATGMQHTPAFHAVNPREQVPVLVNQGHALSQSIAIMEYLEEMKPSPPLLPKPPLERARVRAIALEVACDIHPLSTHRVNRYLDRRLNVGETERNAWSRHWITEGLLVLEKRLGNDPATGDFAHGDQPTMADCCLVPLLHRARLAGCEMTLFPTLLGIERNCNVIPAFALAAPGNQPDAS